MGFDQDTLQVIVVWMIVASFCGSLYGCHHDNIKCAEMAQTPERAKICGEIK